jgi:hypothetical protein
MQLFNLPCVVDKVGTQDGGENMQETKDLDIQAIIDELDKEFESAEDQLDAPVENGEEILEDEFVEDNNEEIEVVSETEEVEEELQEKSELVEDINSEDVHRRNEAFRRLREERDQLAASESFLNDLAKQYGLTKDQLIERFQEDQLKKEAEQQGIPEPQLRKMKELEKKLAQVEEEKTKEVFNIKADALANKYNLNEPQMLKLFEESAKLGLDIVKNPSLLEFAYRAVNYENAINEGRQKQLETTRKRSSTSTGKTGTSGSEVKISEQEAWDKEIEAYLKDLNL